MKYEKLKDEIHKKFKKLDMPYYYKSKITFSDKNHIWKYVYINFVVPYHSLINLMSFCKKNGFAIAYGDGKIEICMYKISKIRKIVGLNEEELR